MRAMLTPKKLLFTLSKSEMMMEFNFPLHHIKGRYVFNGGGGVGWGIIEIFCKKSLISKQKDLTLPHLLQGKNNRK